MSDQIRIVINGRFLTQPVTGVQRYAREVLQSLDRIVEARPDLRVRLLTPRTRVNIPQLNGIRHKMVGCLQGHAWEQLEFPRHVHDDVVFCPGNTAPLWLLFGRHRVVVTVHDLSYLYFPEAYSHSFRMLYGLVVPQVLRRAAVVITVSESEKTAMARHYPEARDRIVVIPNGGLPNGETLEPHRSAKDPYVLYVGSLSRRKNFSAMFDAAVRLVSKRQLKVVFVGSTPPSLQGSTVQMPENLRDRIVFAGQVNSWDELRKYYVEASCLFFPSLYESSGLPPLEAMGCGCPVLASHIPALVERCGDAALYCDPNSVDDMVAKMEMLLDDPGLQQQLSDRGYLRAREFSWENCAKRTLTSILGKA